MHKKERLIANILYDLIEIRKEHVTSLETGIVTFRRQSAAILKTKRVSHMAFNIKAAFSF
jgi:hypothetical protein